MDLCYKKMLKRMQEKARVSRKKKTPWVLYILKCKDGSYYTGITNNLERRVKMHERGRGARYTRTRLPVELLYREACRDRVAALVRECEIKAFPRKKKEKLAGLLNKNQAGKLSIASRIP